MSDGSAPDLQPRSRNEGGGLLDANDVLELTRRLHEERDRINAASVSDEQRGRWLGRLQAIADGASRDLDRANGQLKRLAYDVDRAQPD